MAVACGSIGTFFALFPGTWMGLFSDEEEIIRAGSSYLRITGPIYALYGLGMALYFATPSSVSMALYSAYSSSRRLRVVLASV